MTRHAIARAAALACALFAASHAANATAYTYSDTLGLAAPVLYASPPETYYSFLFPSAPRFTLNVGDSISGTITFANDARLTVSGADLSYLDLRLIGSNGNDANSSTVVLTGVEGSLLPFNQSGDVTYGNSVFAAFVNPLTSSEVSFTGFTYSIDVVRGPDTVSPYDLGVFGDHVSVSSSAVPEPSAAFLFLSGLAALALLRRCTVPPRPTATATA
jgi:hypothetical protein